MTSTRLVIHSARYHWRTNLAVTLGVAAAVSVLAGALLVGDSVRGSLRDIALGRLGRTDSVVGSSGFFREALADDFRASGAGTTAAPLVVASGFVTDESSERTAAGVLVYGVDDRFWQFHGQAPPDGVVVSPALAAELGVEARDVLLVRLQKPSAIPLESLFGRKDDVGRTVRLDVAGVQPRGQLGEFSLRPQQSDVRAVFAPLRRIQRDLAVVGTVNTVLVAGASAPGSADAGIRAVLTLEDLGVKVSTASDPPAVVVEGAMGILSEPLEEAARKAAGEPQVLPVFTYLANTIRKGDRQIPYSLITATDLNEVPGVDGGTLRPAGSAGRYDRAQRVGRARARRIAGRSDRDRLFRLGRRRGPDDPCGRLHARPRGPDRRARRRSPARARVPGDHRRVEPLGVGSAVPGRPLPHPSAGREGPERLPHHAEGVHCVRARAGLLEDAIRRATSIRIPVSSPADAVALAGGIGESWRGRCRRSDGDHDLSRAGFAIERPPGDRLRRGLHLLRAFSWCRRCCWPSCSSALASSSGCGSSASCAPPASRSRTCAGCCWPKRSSLRPSAACSARSAPSPTVS